MTKISFYAQTAKGYNELHGAEQREKITLIKEHLVIKKTDTLLDVGCATGISMDFPCTVVGVDPEIALLRLNKNKNMIQAQGEHLPFKDRSFDIVISITALHNFRDIEKGVLEMKRVGKKRFVLSILKKSRHFSRIEGLIRHYFSIEKRIDSRHDVIFVCK